MASPALTLIYKQPEAAFKFRLGKCDEKCAEMLGFERHAVNCGHRLGPTPGARLLYAQREFAGLRGCRWQRLQR